MPSPSPMPRTWPSRPGARRLPYRFCRRERTRAVGSFDDLVDAGEHHRRDFETEASGSLQVDSQFELGRLHDWKIGRLLPLQNAADKPSPHHSNGIDVPMKRQVWLGCVGSTDCAITRHCSLASSRTWSSGLSRRGRAMRAVLLASAPATTRLGRRWRSPITHGSALVAFERSKLALAPLIRSRRKYWLPRLDIPPRRCLPPVEFCRGTRSSQAANSRPLRKPLGSTTV